MYIKLSIAETALIIPDILNVLLIYIAAPPKICEQLPPESSANEQTEISYLHNDQTDAPEDQLTMLSYYIPKHYHFYIDAGNDSVETLEEAIRIFYDFYEGKLPEAIADDEYPKEIPLVTLFNIALNRARNIHAARKLCFFRIEDLIEVPVPAATTLSGYRK